MRHAAAQPVALGVPQGEAAEAGAHHAQHAMLTPGGMLAAIGAARSTFPRTVVPREGGSSRRRMTQLSHGYLLLLSTASRL